MQVGLRLLRQRSDSGLLLCMCACHDEDSRRGCVPWVPERAVLFSTWPGAFVESGVPLLASCSHAERSCFEMRAVAFFAFAARCAVGYLYHSVPHFSYPLPRSPGSFRGCGGWHPCP